jgi:hypothetical protein
MKRTIYLNDIRLLFYFKKKKEKKNLKIIIMNIILRK